MHTSRPATPEATTEVAASGSSLRMPDTLLIVSVVLLLAALMTFFIPRGHFATEVDGAGRTVVVPGSFQIDDNGEAAGVALFSGDAAPGVLNALFDGLTSGSKSGAAIGVVMFILVVGGSFGLILKTGAIDEGIKWLTAALKERAVLLLPVLTLFFSLGGAVFGMGEEAMAFAVFIIPLVRALGYDAITGVCITYGATQVGFATSWMNPFSVAIAQGIADVPVLSGAAFRMSMWAVFTVAYLLWILRYAKRNRIERPHQVGGFEHAFNRGHAAVLLVLFAGLGWIVWGVMAKGYYLREIATQFLAIGLLSAIAARLSGLPDSRGNDMAEAFKNGAAQLLPAAIVVGIAQGIMILLGGIDPAKPSVVNSLLASTAEAIGGAPAWLAGQCMLVFQSLFNFFVSSGSAQAALTMPLMAPLSDLVGVSRQTAVLAFQLGDGLAHLVYPTSAALMGTLAVAQVPFLQWVRCVWRAQVLLILLSLATVALAVLIGF